MNSKKVKELLMSRVSYHHNEAEKLTNLMSSGNTSVTDRILLKELIAEHEHIELEFTTLIRAIIREEEKEREE